MYGYTITINGKLPARQGDLCYNNIVCSNYLLNKFEQDKIFTETSEYIVLLDGVILNKKEILGDTNIKWVSKIIDLYKVEGETFFSVFRGSFSGAQYDKKANKWVIFGDQIGSKFTFYSQVGDFFCVSEEMGHIYKMMYDNSINYNLSIENAYLLLTFGFMIEGNTLCEQVKKIQPGHYLVYQKGIIEEKQYYLLKNAFDNRISELDAIDIVDENFRIAVRRAFNKDVEYGYKHIVALSGGLDSRMTTFVAHELGFEKQLNYTFSQSDYWDESVPKEIANDLKHEWIFKFLNNGLWLYDVDDVTTHTGGNVLYYGSAHSNSMFSTLSFDKYGIIHTGQVSGALNGSSVKRMDESFNSFNFDKAMFSVKYSDKIRYMLKKQLNQELGWYYYRCLNGTCYGTQILYNYSESYSPFLDIDYLEKILCIPINLRINHNLYKKWILKKYPPAADYVWEKTGHNLHTKTVRFCGREMAYSDILGRTWNYVLKKSGVVDNYNSERGMNPIDYYYTHNPELRKYLYAYFEYIERIEDMNLRNILVEIRDSGTIMEKIQAISLLAAVKLFYNK